MKKDFTAQLAEYKAAIDQDIARYADHVRQATRSEYGEYSAAVTEAYLDLLERGGKRIRGALVMVGYEMMGGKDQTMILRAATALELLHASLLVMDDIQDDDEERRGKPTVHRMLADYHRQLKLKGSASHTGMSLALDAALGGISAANMLLAGLSVESELRLKVVGIVNLTITVTLHGQTYDIVTALQSRPKLDDLERAMEWKTAHYSFLNPLCVGMALAGAGCEDTDAIRSYALHTGMAFQITDNLLDGEVSRTKVKVVRQLAAKHSGQAVQALHAAKRPWKAEQVRFLTDLAEYIVNRAM